MLKKIVKLITIQIIMYALSSCILEPHFLHQFQHQPLIRHLLFQLGHTQQNVLKLLLQPRKISQKKNDDNDVDNNVNYDNDDNYDDDDNYNDDEDNDADEVIMMRMK